jgi:hypothetical protein
LCPGGWCPRKYCSHEGLLYEPSFGSSRLCRQVTPTPTTTPSRARKVR